MIHTVVTSLPVTREISLFLALSSPVTFLEHHDSDSNIGDSYFEHYTSLTFSLRCQHTFIKHTFINISLICTKVLFCSWQSLAYHTKHMNAQGLSTSGSSSLSLVGTGATSAPPFRSAARLPWEAPPAP